MKTKLFINGIGSVSRLKDYNEILDETHEPIYKELIPAIKLRRMSRIMRMSNYAALTALKQASVEIPKAINVGTGFGCLTDTEKFLATLLDNNEKFSNPSAFINSTHNTLAGNLAILLGAKGQNFTFVHPENAFENALMDTWIGMNEGSFDDAIVGGVDEKTNILESVYSSLSNSKIGEGASFLAVSKNQENESFAVIKGIQTDYSKTKTSIFVEHFMDEMGIDKNSIDLVLANELIIDAPIISYKNIVNEYPSVTAFACTLASQIISTQNTTHFIDETVENINNILVHNKFPNGNQSLILISKV